MGLLLFVLPYICSFFFLSRFSSKISPQPFKIETSYLVYRSTTTSCIVGLQMGILLFVLPFVCSFFFLSKFLSKISPQPFRIETSYVVYRFTTTSCIVGLKMGFLLFVLHFICSFFFLSRFFVKDISTTVYDRNFKFGIQVHNKLYRGIENGHSPICSSLYLFFFSFSPDFLSKISPQQFKIETSNLVYRFTTTSCIVGLKMGLLLFVHPYICSFFFLFRFFVKDISTTV